MELLRKLAPVDLCRNTVCKCYWYEDNPTYFSSKGKLTKWCSCLYRNFPLFLKLLEKKLESANKKIKNKLPWSESIIFAKSVSVSAKSPLINIRPDWVRVVPRKDTCSLGTSILDSRPLNSVDFEPSSSQEDIIASSSRQKSSGPLIWLHPLSKLDSLNHDDNESQG